MRILLTNHALAERSGTELYIRDVALALLRRGHRPIAYSRRLGEVADELRRATVPVVDDLAKLGRAPDVIHAQHHLETMTALAHFPDVPAVYVCHGWLPDQEAPPRHPRILHYAAVDSLVRERLVHECGLEPERTSLLLNFVDLERFRARGPLPERPRKALVFSNYVSDENCLDALRHACLLADLELDVIGRGHGQPEARPEERLGDYDVVFAKGRSALEAAAVGTAVVLCDAVGLGPMVSSGEFDRLRGYNFGVRLLRSEVSAEKVFAELERYDARDAAIVSRRLREESSIDDTVEALIALYGRVREQTLTAPVAPEQASRAVSSYLRHGPLTGGDLHSAERERLVAEVAHQKARTAELRRAAEAFDAERRAQTEELMRSQTRVATLEAEYGQLARSLDEAERKAVEAEKATKANQQQLEVLQGVLDETRLALDGARRLLKEQREDLAAERDRRRRAECQIENEARQRRWIEDTATWRLRGGLLRLPGLAFIYRSLSRRRPAKASSQDDAPLAHRLP